MRKRTNRALLTSLGLHVVMMLAASPFLINHFSVEKESISAEILELKSQEEIRRRVLPPRPPDVLQVDETEASTSTPASPTYAPEVSVPKAPIHADVVPDIVTYADIPHTDAPSPVSNASFGEDGTAAGPVVIEEQRGSGIGGDGNGSGYGTGTGGDGRGGNGIGKHFASLTGVSDVDSEAIERIDYLFTFVRLRYNNSTWKIDWPDSDRNFIRQLQERTTVDVAPEEKIIDIGSKELFRYPFAYIAEVSGMRLTHAEAKNLREYLLRGGFILVDDFHGQRQWMEFYAQFKRIFPKREPEDIPMPHPLFHCFYQIDELIQIPGSGAARSGKIYQGSDGYPARCLGVYDDDGRLMMMINFNQDLGDGWEHAEDAFYPDKYSDMAFKMGTNAVIYSLTPEHSVYQNKPRVPDALKKLHQRLEKIEKIERSRG